MRVYQLVVSEVLDDARMGLIQTERARLLPVNESEESWGTVTDVLRLNVEQGILPGLSLHAVIGPFTVWVSAEQSLRYRVWPDEPIKPQADGRDALPWSILTLYESISRGRSVSII